ncbi:GNAT family N-acetyltransferase [Sandaracinus amylolyticus]|uniref:Acetyltransferase, GNAT family n=1 Tax=Sandaracinus amylolyticus TaxID=927083 RepID=A0A0F6WA11_9BACT|nr:GNAT family N-acetyltransferase [Sandaracinus amylolyticus]AKF11256.1 acetyltransferase, GNAT family [Sandaracinus amylolyticus]
MIVPFEPAHAQGVIALVVPIQRDEFSVPITAEEQPDLLDPVRFFRRGAGDFWVALERDRVIGTVGLLDVEGLGVLRKMFVAKEHRGSGLAARLLEVAIERAVEERLESIVLGTVDVLKGAHRFYEKHGFTRIDERDLPARFPRVAVDTVFYERRLG